MPRGGHSGRSGGGPIRHRTMPRGGHSGRSGIRHNSASRSSAALRNPHAQASYRKQSRSQRKATKDVSHNLSLQLAHKMLGRRAVNEQKTKAFLNHPGNLRMVNKSTNRSDHRAIDNKLLEKAQTGKKLTKSEEDRARQQTKSCQSRQETCPPALYAAAKETYKKMKTSDGTTLWDARKDK